MSPAPVEVTDAPDWPSTAAADKDNSVEQPPLRSLPSRLCHWGPIVAIVVTLDCGIVASYVHTQWWPFYSVWSILDFLVFLLWNYLTLNNICTAAYVGPGFVPLRWRPPFPADEAKLQWCAVCEGFKAPRSHHCRKCGRCVMKMDHHCPWINNCTGHKNHAYFVRFLAFAVIGCIHAAIILGCGIYRAIFRVWYLYYGTGSEPIVNLGFYGLIAAIFAFGLAVGVICSVGFLLFIQLRAIYRNRTGIEDYIMDKVCCRERDDNFVYPYDVGKRRNFAEVLGTWSGRPKGEGFWWPVVKGCDQFTFTLEQMAQKESKLQRSRVAIVVRPYQGGLCVFRYGIGTLFCQPFTDEPRIPVYPGQHYMITRAYKYWVYGGLVTPVSRDSANGFSPGGDVAPSKTAATRSPKKPSKSISSSSLDGEEEVSAAAAALVVRRGLPSAENGSRGWFPRAVIRKVHDVMIVSAPNEQVTADRPAGEDGERCADQKTKKDRKKRL